MQCVLGALFPGVKRPGREADHSPSGSVEVKKIHFPIRLHGVVLNSLSTETTLPSYVTHLLSGNIEIEESKQMKYILFSFVEPGRLFTLQEASLLNMVMQLKRTDDYVIFAGTKVSCLRMRM
jgi:hypothetical protein